MVQRHIDQRGAFIQGGGVVQEAWLSAVFPQETWSSESKVQAREMWILGIWSTGRWSWEMWRKKMWHKKNMRSRRETWLRKRWSRKEMLH